MRLSIETGWLRRRYDDFTALKMIKEAGFDAVDYTFGCSDDQPEKDILEGDYLKKAYELRDYMDKIGIECSQAHTPLEFRYTEKPDLTTASYARNIRSMEIASVLGADNIIVHGLGIVYAEGIDYIEYNTKYLRTYLPYCEKYNIKVSYENSCAISKEKKAVPIPGVHTAEEYMRFIDLIGNEWFNICVDTGHAAVVGMEPEVFIRGLNNKYLKALHVHENDRSRDQHLLPYSGNFDWDKITAALKEINYNGDFTFESTNFFAPIPNELIEDALRYCAKMGRFLINKIER